MNHKLDYNNKFSAIKMDTVRNRLAKYNTNLFNPDIWIDACHELSIDVDDIYVSNKNNKEIIVCGLLQTIYNIDNSKARIMAIEINDIYTKKQIKPTKKPVKIINKK